VVCPEICNRRFNVGCYDSVMVPCPKCGEKSEFQSKSGDCCLSYYDLQEAPADVLLNVNRHAPNTCEKCGTLFQVELAPVLRVVEVTEETITENDSCLICHEPTQDGGIMCLSCAEKALTQGMAKAPWTEEQVKSLAERQACGAMHEYTCGECPGIKAELIPTPDGWFCPQCEKLVQDWAHRSDADGEWRKLAEWRLNICKEMDATLEEM
jgi:hypothetical protein